MVAGKRWLMRFDLRSRTGWRLSGTLVALVLLAVACGGKESTSQRAGESPSARGGTSFPSSTARPSTEPLTAPVARGYAMMADLPGEPGVILLGGADVEGPPDLPDMWAFSPDGTWQDVAPASLPALQSLDGIIGNAFAFDSDSGKGVFVDIEGHPWAYDPAAKTWQATKAKGGPVALLGTVMVYDSQSDRMILFGGLDLGTGTLNGQTWAYDLNTNNWERMHPRRSPSARNYHAMAYDEGSDRVILFGGDSVHGIAGDTWAYDYETDTWTRMSPSSSPSARAYSWMTYDSRGDRMILFGGSGDGDTGTLADTWAYDLDHDAWSELEVDGPSARAWHAMAFDAQTNTLVLFGGGHSRGEYTAETWLFDPAEEFWSRWP